MFRGLSWFRSNAWPGDERRLESLIHRGVLLTGERETIEIEDVYNALSTEADYAQNGHTPGEKLHTIEDAERPMILQTLDESNNSQEKAAGIPGISARTIRDKRRKYRSGGNRDPE